MEPKVVCVLVLVCVLTLSSLAQGELGKRPPSRVGARATVRVFETSVVLGAGRIWESEGRRRALHGHGHGHGSSERHCEHVGCPGRRWPCLAPSAPSTSS